MCGRSITGFSESNPECSEFNGKKGLKYKSDLLMYSLSNYSLLHRAYPVYSGDTVSWQTPDLD